MPEHGPRKASRPPDTRAGHDRCYRVTGHFYHRPGTRGPYPCRSTLDIVRTTSRGQAIDAFVVMMNPGSSCPVDPSHDDARRSVRTIPDTTQYRIMALMDRLGWNRVRVINLSDLRDPQSGRFFEQMRRYRREHGDCGHSIFSPARVGRLKVQLRTYPKAPIVVAWGVARALEPLARMALAALPGERIVGRPGRQGGWRYWHPLPRRATWQALWLSDIVRQVRKRPGASRP